MRKGESRAVCTFSTRPNPNPSPSPAPTPTPTPNLLDEAEELHGMRALVGAVHLGLDLVIGPGLGLVYRVRARVRLGGRLGIGEGLG
jgi:hypothetical protein